MKWYVIQAQNVDVLDLEGSGYFQDGEWQLGHVDQEPQIFVENGEVLDEIYYQDDCDADYIKRVEEHAYPSNVFFVKADRPLRFIQTSFMEWF